MQLKGNRKYISGPVMAVLNSLRFGDEQPRDGHKNHFKKIHFLFYAIAVAGLAPVGALQ